MEPTHAEREKEKGRNMLEKTLIVINTLSVVTIGLILKTIIKDLYLGE